MALETTRFDASEYLDNPAVIAAYISEALETNDPAFIAAAIGDVARAYGMSAIADAAGVSRGSLYHGLSRDGNPDLATVVSVLRAFGLSLAAKPVKSAAKKPARKSARPRRDPIKRGQAATIAKAS